MASKKKVSKSTFVESRALPETTDEKLAHDAALQIFSDEAIPLGWAATPREWLIILHMAEEKIAHAITQAKVSPQA